MRLILLFIILCAFSFHISAQSLIVSVEDSTTSDPLVSATIYLVNKKDSNIQYTSYTNNQGSFLFENLKVGYYWISVNYVGYSLNKKTFRIEQNQTYIMRFKMKIGNALLKEIDIEADATPVQQRGDTTSYNAKAFKTNPDATAEDLVRKMPGISVENGTVKTNGEDVKKVLVDGKPYFGDDPNVALKNLPSQIVDRIEVYDQQSDQAQFTGFDDGNSTKTINIITKTDLKFGQFGKYFGGLGLEKQYNVGFNHNFFNGDQRLTIMGLGNNINEQNFSTQDLTGIMGSSASSSRSGGGGRNSTFSNQGNPSDFLIGNQSGINTTYSFGLNFTDDLGKKTKLNLSYFFNNSSNDQIQELKQTYFTGALQNQDYNQSNNSTNQSANHRVNLRLEYKINQTNSIVFTPSANLQFAKSNSDILGNTVLNPDTLNSTANGTKNLSDGLQLTNSLLYRHSFEKKGRTVSLLIRNNLNGNSQLSSYKAKSLYYNQLSNDTSFSQESNNVSQSNSNSVNLTYTEPISKSGQLYGSYQLATSPSISDKETYNLAVDNYTRLNLDTLLSSSISSNYITQSVASGLRMRTKSLFGSVGLTFQNATLESNRTFPINTEIKRDFQSLLPNAMVRYTINPSKSLSVYYRSRTSSPSVNQLQEVVNNTNPLQLSTGNSHLVQSVNHNLNIRYSIVNKEKARNLSANISLSTSLNYLGTATYIASDKSLIINDIILDQGVQLRVPANLKGQLNARTYINYSKSLKKLKSNLSLSANYSYVQTPGLINDQMNLSQTQTLAPNIGITSNVSEKVDFSISYSTNFNFSVNTLQSTRNNNYTNNSFYLKGNFLIKKNWVIRSELSTTWYFGLSNNLDQNYTLWNVKGGRKIFKSKSCEIGFTLFDILNQNNSIGRNIAETYFIDYKNNTLNRYFMVNFSYTFKNYKQKKEEVLPELEPEGK